MIWTYILTSIMLVSSFVSLIILIYCLVELGKLSFDNTKKKKEKKENEENKKLQEMEKRIQSYVDYKQEELFYEQHPYLQRYRCPQEVVDYNKKDVGKDKK